MNTTANEYVASNLTTGTSYTVIVNTVLDNGLESLHKQTISSFTRPNGLIDIDIPVEKVHETNATIDITPPVDGLYDHIVVNLSKNSGAFVNTFKNMTVITDLTAATKYKVEVFTATITDLTSSENITREFYTRPATPSVGIATERDLDYITFDLTGNTGTFDQFEITYENGTLLANVSRAGDKQFNATGLTAGTEYAYTVFTNYLGLRSDGYFLITAYTKPEQISDMKITHITNDAINVEWKAPSVGNVTSYMSEIFCLGPNDNSKVKLFNNTSSALIAVATGLEPGSICNASVTTQINDNNTLIHGKTATDTFVNRTTETGPQEIQDLSKNQTTSRSITIEWERPSIRNGVISGYEINVVQDGNNIHTQNLNCTSCTITNTDNDLRTIAKTCADASLCDNAISEKRLRYNITDLHPFRTYNVSVVAKTSLPGITFAATYNTDESVPTGPPLNIQHSTTATAIELTWTPPSYGERNGIITKYNISYTFRKRTCFDDGGVDVTKHVSQKDNSTTRTLTGLDPYTYHDVRIQALTSIGEGPFSDFLNISTKQSKPSVVRELNVTETTNESIALSWVQPCRPNGEIKKYTIYLTNTDDNTKSNRTSIDNHIDIRDDILPYSNYSITVAGNTIIGEGNKTQDDVVRTKVGVPKIPRNIDAKNVSSTILNITWATPELYTGPTHYTIVATDYVNQSQQISKHVSGFKAQTAIIDTLEKYWLYNVSVIAETDAGRAESTRNLIRTDEDVPDKVKGLSVIPESDVTKPRTIKVKWNLLTAREMNGVLKGYTVRYSIQSGTETNDTLGISSREFVIKGIDPGQYTIKVSASTSKGKGIDNSQSTTLEAGAPLMINESSANPLIRPASIAVNNDETQIAIELPISSFLCTKSNGEPTEWGVIVSEDSAATDAQFFGTKTAFDNRKNTTYKRWVEAKDINPMPAYIATKPGVYDPCKHIGSRKKRSASGQTGSSFTVGTEGKCSGVTGYCNGELPPGRSFRVKSYVCTAGGCTETKYSQPIRTVRVEAPNLTVPVAAGVSAAVVVIVAVIIVVAVLKRKQLACFKKDIESTSTHRPGDGMEFDRIESTKRRPFTPGQIKLVDFPERVEVMHKDSDLIFADAFKLLREKSPSHPMTAAEAQCSRPKNRYTNILPFDHSRVKLRPSDDVDGSDYVNANYIPGYTSRREYIATQGPMPATFDDFWRMVWEQNVDTIVMLTKLMENGRHKCDKYWPDLSEPVYYGDLVVTVSSESNLSDYTIRIIEVKSKNVSKKVQQFSYLKWPDMGSPETPDLLLEFVKNVRNYTKREKHDQSSGPTIVHCSAGVGRTGTFIAVDTLLQHIRDHDEVDIFDLVLSMRNHRLNMVQTEDQYVYIHECVKSFISTDEDEPDDEEEPVYINTMQTEENVYENTAFNADN